MLRAEAGQTERVAELYEELRDDVYRYLAATGIQPQTSQELTQDAFLRLHAALLDGNTITNPRAWIFTVARNLAVNSRRRPEPGGSGEEVDLVSTAEGDNPEAQVLRAERMARVHRAFAGLSPQQRQCLSLRAEGFQYKEIAGMMGLAVPTVGEFLRRGIVKLKDALR
jgi:RNA polymerase sigma-70 factor (ECF subfamily)